VNLNRDGQAAVVALLRGLGFDVTVFSTNRRSRIRPGFPDIFAMHYRLPGLLWESKVKGGKLSPKQAAFAALCEQYEMPYGWGGYAEAEQFLKDWGVL